MLQPQFLLWYSAVTLNSLKVPDSSKTACLSPSIPIGEAIKFHSSSLGIIFDRYPTSLYLRTSQSPIFLFLKTFLSLNLFHCYHLTLPSPQRPPQSNPGIFFQRILHNTPIPDKLTCLPLECLLYTLVSSIYSSHFLISLANLHDLSSH